MDRSVTHRRPLLIAAGHHARQAHTASAIAAGPGLAVVCVAAVLPSVGILHLHQIEELLPIGALFGERCGAVADFDPAGRAIAVEAGVLHVAQILAAGDRPGPERTAIDGFDALSKIADHQPDLIFVDIMMPRLDGYQTCSLIKHNKVFKDTPVIMLSSKDGLFDRARGRIVGSEQYLTKPFTKDELLGAISNQIN